MTASTMMRQCKNCSNDFDILLETCPHCGIPADPVPCVALAELPGEVAALDDRYSSACAAACANGCDTVRLAFEACAAGAEAVLCRSLEYLMALATSSSNVYGSYHGQLQGGVRVPSGEIWDRIRPSVDGLLYGMNMNKICFAALSVDGRGVPSYGALSIVLKENLIARRAVVFEENSVDLLDRFSVPASRPQDLPKGFRAPWRNRGKLAVAKLAPKLTPQTAADQYPGLLVAPGDPADANAKDDFVEVHIWGPFSILAVDRVVYSAAPGAKISQADLKKLRTRLNKFNVVLEGL